VSTARSLGLDVNFWQGVGPSLDRLVAVAFPALLLVLPLVPCIVRRLVAPSTSRAERRTASSSFHKSLRTSVVVVDESRRAGGGRVR
jgi:hypothetical protein